MSRALVLNASYEPLSVVSSRRAFLLTLNDKAESVHFSGEIFGNVAVKMIAQPLVMAGLVVVLAVAPPLSREAILMCAIPTSAFSTLLAPRYGVYEDEAASTLVLTTIAMIVVMPLAIALTG